MTDLSKFLRYVLPYATGCSEISAINALRQAAIDFCRDTSAWTELLDAQPVMASVADYEIEAPTNGQIVQVLDAYLDGLEIPAKSIDELRRIYVNPSWLEAKGKPTFFTTTAYGSVRLVPEPEEAIPGGLVIRAAFMPTQTATSIPDFFYYDHAQDLASGALSYLLMEQARSYTDPANGIYHAKRFKAAMSHAVIDNNRANARAGLRVRYVRM